MRTDVGDALRIASLSALDSLLEDARRGHRSDVEEIVVAFSELRASENAYWRRRITRLYHACGCDVGAIAAVLGLASALLWLFVVRDASGNAVWTRAGMAGLVAVAAAVTGKLAGLYVAGMRLRVAIARLSDAVRDRQRELANANSNTRWSVDHDLVL